MAEEIAAQRTDLADLVRVRMEELGLSYRGLPALCIDPKAPDAGPLWTRGTVENLAKRRVIKAPKPAELRALAAGLSLPLRLVQEAAAAQFFGIETVWSEEDDVRLLVRDYRALGPEDRERLREIARAWGPGRSRELDDDQ